MSAKNYNIIRGNTWQRTLTFTDANGDAIDITGWTLFLTLKTTAQMSNTTDTGAALQKNFTTFSDPTNGVAIINITAAESALLLSKYKYDIQYKKDSGEIGTVVNGDMTFNKDVTIRISA